MVLDEYCSNVTGAPIQYSQRPPRFNRNTSKHKWKSQEDLPLMSGRPSETLLPRGWHLLILKSTDAKLADKESPLYII